jgi:hypothetical protein
LQASRRLPVMCGEPMATGVTVTTWPSAFVGLRI